MLTVLVDWVLSALAGWPPLLVLVLVSALAGVLMAVVFRFTSNQRALRRDADQSRAQILAIKLFQDDIATMLGSLGQLVRSIGWRLWHSLPPMLVMVVPFVLLLAQLARWYEHSPLGPGERAVVQVQINPAGWPKYRQVSLEAARPLAVETSPLRDEETRTIYWRIRAMEARPAVLRWSQGSERFDKQLAVARDTERLCAIDSRRPGHQWWDRLLHPGEAGFAAGSPVEGIVIHYPTRSTPLLGLDVPWWCTFLVVSIVAAAVARPLVKVQF